jgi:HlyD family secretion protein
VSPRNKFLIILGIIFAGSLAFYFFTSRKSNDLVLVGTVDANQVIVSSKIAGRIEKLAVDEGSQVKEGDLIAEIDSGELTAEQQAAKANIDVLQARIREAQANERLASGSTSSDVLAAQAKLQSAQADLMQAQADLERTQSDTDRAVSLAKQGVASQQSADQAVALLKAAQARVQSLQKQVAAADAQVRAAIAQTNQAHAAVSNVAATRQQLAQAQAQLAQAETRLGYTRIVAPVAGTVSVRAARQGEVVNPGQAIVTIMDLSDTWVRASIPETQADSIRIGDTLNVRLPSGRIIPGKLIFKGVEGSFATQRDVGRLKRDINTVSLKLSVANPNAMIVPGMTAEVLIPQDKLKTATAPATAATGAAQ